MHSQQGYNDSFRMISVDNYANEARCHVGRHQVGCFQFNVQYLKAFSE